MSLRLAVRPSFKIIALPRLLQASQTDCGWKMKQFIRVHIHIYLSLISISHAWLNAASFTSHCPIFIVQLHTDVLSWTVNWNRTKSCSGRGHEDICSRSSSKGLALWAAQFSQGYFTKQDFSISQITTKSHSRPAGQGLRKLFIGYSFKLTRNEIRSTALWKRYTVNRKILFYTSFIFTKWKLSVGIINEAKSQKGKSRSHQIGILLRKLFSSVKRSIRTRIHTFESTVSLE